MIRDRAHAGPVVIDLAGPEGNAFALLGLASKYAKQLGFDQEDHERIQAEMMSGDYENLLQVFDENFGDYVILER